MADNTPTLRDHGIELRNEMLGQHATTCPRCAPAHHNKNSQCLSVLVEYDTTLWNCHRCGWTGSLRDGTTSKSNPNGYKPEEYKRPKLTNEHKWSDRTRTFFRDRRISEEVLSRNRISVDRVWMPQFEGFVEAVLFPFFRAGECINIKYRAQDKAMKLEINAERIFYGLDDLIVEGDGEKTAREHAIIVEGEMDKLAMEVAGYKNVISVPNGAPAPTTKNLEKFFDFIENSNYKLNPDDKEGLLDRIAMFKIAVDSDEAGRKLEDELIRRFGAERCVRVRWPKREDGTQIKDANDVLIELGADALREAIDNAKPVPIAGVFRIEDFEDLLDDYYENGLPPGLSTGWDSFKDSSGKDLYTLNTGMLSLITGIPGHGKSNFIDDLTIHAAMQHAWSFAYFAPESQPLQLHASMLLEKYAAVPFNRGYQHRMDGLQYQHAKEFVNDHYHFMLPEDSVFTIDDILDKATILVRRHGIKGVIVDPWNNLWHSRPAGAREDEYIGMTLQKIRRWMRRYDVWFCVAAHPKKLEKVAKGKDPVPTPYDIKGGSEWFDMADFCLSVWRDKTDETLPTEVHVQKVKFRHLGVLGVAELNYDKPTGKYYDTGNHAETVKVKRMNSDNSPMFDAPPPEEAPYWLRD